MAKVQQKDPELRNPAVTAIEGNIEREKKTPPASGWQDLAWIDVVPQLAPEVHDGAPAYQMNNRRLSLHTPHICLYVRLGGPTHIVGLSVAQGKKSEGRATIHALPYNHEACHTLCNAMAAHLGNYAMCNGEPQELVSQRAMHELLRPSRCPNVNTADETAMLGAQNYECALCGDWLTRDASHLDHTMACFWGGSDAVLSSQAVGVQCHVWQRHTERLSNVEEDHPLMSRCNR